MPRRARGAVVIKKGKQQILERSALENLSVLPLFMISVVILESRSPGSVVITRGHPELAACKVRPAGGYPAVITRGHPEFSSGSTDCVVCWGRLMCYF